MWLNPQETADLVTFTEEIFNGKLHFLCSERRVHVFRKRLRCGALQQYLTTESLYLLL